MKKVGKKVSKTVLRKKIDSLARIKQYFLRGHSSWFALMLSLVQFTLIAYNDLFEKLFFVPDILKSYFLFFLIFIITYFPLVTFFGYMDYRKGTFKAEQKLAAEMSPVWKEVFGRLDSIEKKMDEILVKDTI